MSDLLIDIQKASNKFLDNPQQHKEHKEQIEKILFEKYQIKENAIRNEYHDRRIKTIARKTALIYTIALNFVFLFLGFAINVIR